MEKLPLLLHLLSGIILPHLMLLDHSSIVTLPIPGDMHSGVFTLPVVIIVCNTFNCKPLHTIPFTCFIQSSAESADLYNTLVTI